MPCPRRVLKGWVSLCSLRYSLRENLKLALWAREGYGGRINIHAAWLFMNFSLACWPPGVLLWGLDILGLESVRKELVQVLVQYPSM